MKHSRVSRIVKILTTLQSGQKYSPAALENLLGISRRTVFRDLKELAAIGVPYKYDSRDGGYSIDPKFFLPPVDLTLPEALSLLMLVHKMRNHLPLPFKNSALLAGLKIENNLPADVRQYCQLSLQRITVAPDQCTNIKSLDCLYDILSKAVRNKRIVGFEYKSLYDKKTVSVILHPYHLLYKRRSWYAIGYSQEHKELRTFNLARMGNVKMQEKCFAGGDNFDVNDYLGRAWSLIPEGRLYDVVLRFSPLVAANVAEVLWHGTQQNKWEPDGSLTVDFRVDGLEEISWWVLGYGDQVQIIAPALLRKKVLQRAEKMLEIHQKL